MDRWSGTWRKKALEKNSGESESSGSLSPYSERYSDEQERFGSSPTESSLNHETAKSLTEKLLAARLDAAAKEDLIKQHSKVTEEAISGWETAEAELATLKQKIESCSSKNSVLEDRVSHLEEALKECVRQLRQSREEQEQIVQNAFSKPNEWEAKNSDLENQIKELYSQLAREKTQALHSIDKPTNSRLESLEKENNSLKAELLVQSEQLRVCTIERDLSTQTAELASKQHLESIKKLAKFESECRRLQALDCRATSTGYHYPALMKNLAGDKSENHKHFCAVYNDLESLDSWASTLLIAQLDQFDHEKLTPIKMDIMDDFLEMEKLVATTPETDNEISANNLADEFNSGFASDKSLRNELAALRLQVTELDKKAEKIENEKADLQIILAETQNHLEASCNQLALVNDKIVNIERKWGLTIESKDAAIAKAFVELEARRKEMESRLVMENLEVMAFQEKVELLQDDLNEKRLPMDWQVQLDSAFKQSEALREQVSLLEGTVEDERALSGVYLAKAKAIEPAQRKLEIQLMSANSELENFNKTIGALKLELQEERLSSAKLADRAKTSEFQLESVRNHGVKLENELRHFLEKVVQERDVSADQFAKCQALEKELSRRKKEAELCPNITRPMLNKEKEMSEAAGKLAECQRTIASLGQQLNSLTKIDESCSSQP